MIPKYYTDESGANPNHHAHGNKWNDDEGDFPFDVFDQIILRFIFKPVAMFSNKNFYTT